MTLITPEDEAAFRRRYRGPNCEGNLAYAKAQAVAYAERYAAGFPDWVQHGIAALHFRHCYTPDTGERVLLRISIDCLLELGAIWEPSHEGS